MTRPIAHITNRAELEANFKTGKKTKTLCGIKGRAIHAPKDWPVCPRCVEVLLKELASRPSFTFGVTVTSSNTASNWTFVNNTFTPKPGSAA